MQSNKPFLILIMLFIPLWLNAQNETIQLVGKVSNDSLIVENVHIINLNTNTGTVSNKYGNFKINAKLGDKIQFTAIQFQTKIIVISNNHLKLNHLTVTLNTNINQLEEVILDHKNKTKGINALTLDLPNAGKKPLNQIERKLNYYSQAPIPMLILATLLGQQGGLDDLYNVISGNRKKHRKLKSLIDKDQELILNKKYVENIRANFKDDFFIKELNIPIEKINLFISYCIPKGIISLYNKGRLIEVIDIFIKESEKFNQPPHLTKDY